jgi:hypothetical protein
MWGHPTKKPVNEVVLLNLLVKLRLRAEALGLENKVLPQHIALNNNHLLQLLALILRLQYLFIEPTTIRHCYRK